MTRRKPRKPTKRSLTPTPAEALDRLARAEHDAREVVRRKRRRAAKRMPKRLDAYDWPADIRERRSA